MIRPLALIVLLLSAVPLAAQDGAPPPDELLALNFYLQQGDSAATEAELRRLQIKYPGWTPPDDLSRLSVTGPTTEIDEIYRLIAASDFVRAREAITAAQAAWPSWNPPEDMLALLAVGEGQVALDQALTAGDAARAIEIATGTPGLLRCDRINNAWRIAEAQAAAAGGKPAALGTYRAVLSACVDPVQLSATLEKADPAATTEELEALFAGVEARFPDRRDEWQALKARLMAGRGVAVAAPAAGTPDATAPTIRPRPRPDPAARAAPAAAAAPRASGGAGSGGGGGGSTNSVNAAAAAGDWTRCLALSDGSRIAAVIYQRGWCAYNLERPMEAAAAFRTALDGRLDASQKRDARYGLALAYLKMQMPEEASRLAAATGFTAQQRLDIERQILDQRGVAAYQKRQYRQAIDYFNELERLNGSIRRDLAILRAYAYLNGGNQPEARRQFQRLHDQMATTDSLRGLQASE